MKSRKPLLLLLVLFGLAAIGCEPPRDSYRLGLVFTSDCKGYVEDCG